MEPLADASSYADLIGTAPAGVDVDRLCEAASATVRAYCGWIIGPSVAETFTINGTGTFRVFLPTMHLTGVTSVTDSGTTLDLAHIDWATEGWLEWAQSSYGYIRPWAYPGRFSNRPRGIVAAVTHGFPEVPADVEALVCSMVARQATSPAGVVREQALAQSVSYSQVAPNVSGGLVLMQHEKAILDAYRIPRMR